MLICFAKCSSHDLLLKLTLRVSLTDCAVAIGNLFVVTKMNIICYCSQFTMPGQLFNTIIMGKLEKKYKPCFVSSCNVFVERKKVNLKFFLVFNK